MAMGKNLTVLSMFGLVALAGVAVNDTLVLVDFINRARREGVALGQSVRQAAPVTWVAAVCIGQPSVRAC